MIKKVENYEENREKMLDQNKEYYKEKRDNILDQKKDYYKEQKEQILDQKKEYYHNNRDDILKKKAASYKDSKPVSCQRQRFKKYLSEKATASYLSDQQQHLYHHTEGCCQPETMKFLNHSIEYYNGIWYSCDETTAIKIIWGLIVWYV